MGERLGIELPDIYDGVSVWQEPDGTYTNRWAVTTPDGAIVPLAVFAIRPSTLRAIADLIEEYDRG